MEALCHRFLQCVEQVFDVVILDMSHGGDLEYLVGERAFSAVDDEAFFAQCFAEFGEIHAFGQADAGDGVGEHVIGVEEVQSESLESLSEELCFFCLTFEAIIDAFFGDDFEGFVECDEECDAWRVWGLKFVVKEVVMPGEAEVIVSDGIGGQALEFVDFTDDK